MVVVCLLVAETRPAKRSAGGTCVKNIKGLVDYDRKPMNVNNYTCYNRDECFSAFASIMVFNTISKKMETLNITVACIKRVSCQHGKKNITKKLIVDTNRQLSRTVISCSKRENEISVVLPKVEDGVLVYKKVIYDCKCPPCRI